MDGNGKTVPGRRSYYNDHVLEYRTPIGQGGSRYFTQHGREQPQNNQRTSLSRSYVCLVLALMSVLFVVGVVLTLIGSTDVDSSNKQAPQPECSHECDIGEVSNDCNGCVCPSSELTGRITDTKKRPLCDATISDDNDGSRILAVTDSLGYFTATGVCPVVQTMIVRKDRYVTASEQTMVQDRHSVLNALLQTKEHPFFVVHPLNKWRVVGSDVTFCCEAEGSPILKYMWLKNGIPIQFAQDDTILLTSVTPDDSGRYQCLASNDVGSVMSRAAELSVTQGVDFCDREPMEKLLQLPSNCIQPDTNDATVNVGTCEQLQCYTGDDQRGCRDRYCCQADSHTDITVQCQGYEMSVTKTLSCSCAQCTEKAITVSGHVEMLNGERVPGINIYIDNIIVSSSDTDGAFSFRNPSQESRIPVTFRDERGQRTIVDSTRVINTNPGLDIYLPIILAHIPVPTVIQSASDSLLSVGTFAKIDIPSNSFYDQEGQQYSGEVLAYVSTVDMRELDDLQLATGDFSAVNSRGEMLNVRSFGMFSLAFSDPNGEALSVSNNLVVSIEPVAVPRLTAIDHNVKLWTFEPQTGLWIQESTFESSISERRRRRRQESSFKGTLFQNSDWDWFNIGEPEADNLFWAQIVAHTDDELTQGDTILGAKVTAITGDGQPPFYRVYENFISSNSVCLPVGCKAGEIPYVIYFTAKIGSGQLSPAGISLPGLTVDTSDLSNLEYSTSGELKNSIRINPRMENVSPDGPLFNSIDVCESATEKYFQFFAGNLIDSRIGARTRRCFTLPKPLVTWKSWDTWGPCSVTCGNGHRMRRRQCNNCDGDAIDYLSCTSQECLNDKNWGEWSDCSVSCGSGQQLRYRTCKTNGCKDEDVRPCTEDECSTWGSWMAWSDCSVTCGEGTQVRQRRCSEENLCDGNGNDEKVCRELGCDGSTWSEWSSWSDCSVTCGAGLETRTRVCNTVLGGICAGTRTTNSRQCSPQLCDITPAGWTGWSAWGVCTPICGPGQQGRTRQCLDPASTGIPCDGQNTSLQTCNIGSCGWTSWTSWGSCDVTCGGGERVRTRVCAAPTGSSVSDLMCAGQPSGLEVCSDWNCPVCSRTCDVGVLNAMCDACVCDSSTLDGKITDSTNRPLFNVTISYADRPYIPLTVTDNTGSFSIPGVCATATMMVITKVRYGTVIQETTVADATTSYLRAVMERMELPLITEHPRNKVRVIGDSVAFCCMADAVPAIDQYEWFKNGDILEFQEANIETLIVTDLVVEDSGSYRCRVSNAAGSVYSDKASLRVTDTPSGCDSVPVSQYKEMPPECNVPGNRLDVGTCSRAQCGGDKADQTQCMDSEEYCCLISSSTLTQINCTDYTIDVLIVQACECKPCEIEPATISGVATNGNNVPLFFGSIFVNDQQVAMTDINGRFMFQIAAQTTRVAITFKDTLLLGQLLDATRVVNVGRGSNIYITVTMKMRPTPMELYSDVENAIPLAGEEFEPVAELIIPPDCVYDSNGDQYTGKVMLSVNNIDLRRRSDLPLVEGDFSALNDDGEMLTLQSFGMFSFTVTDPSMNPLTIGGSVPIRVDPGQVPMGDVGPGGVSDVKLWTLNRKTGVWEEEGLLVGTVLDRKRRQTGARSNDFFAGSFDITNENVWNIDRILYDFFRGTGNEEGCVAKVIPYASENLSPTEVLGDILFTIVSEDTDAAMSPTPWFQFFYGWSLTYYYGELIEEVGECVTIACDILNGGRYENYISANGGSDLQGIFILPARDTCSGVSSSCKVQNGADAAELTAIQFAIDGDIIGGDPNEAIRISPGVPTSPSGNTGPIYRWNKRNDCRAAPITSQHLQYYFPTAGNVIAVDTFSGFPNIEPCSFYSFNTGFDLRPCYIRIEIESSALNAVRVTVISSATNTALFTSSACSGTSQYGVRQLTARRDSSPMGTGRIEACVEYKCTDPRPAQVGTFPSQTNVVNGMDITEVEVIVRDDLTGSLLSCMYCTTLTLSPLGIPVCGGILPETSLTFMTVDSYGDQTGLYQGPIQTSPTFNLVNHNLGDCQTTPSNPPILFPPSANALKIICP